MSSRPQPSIPVRRDRAGSLRGYVRIAALGDSLTYGLGDATSAGYRGWARILADAVGQDHDVSFLNVARPGATAQDLRLRQLDAAVSHRPHLASLIVGLNDTMRSSWDPVRLHDNVMAAATELSAHGALLMTARFHDHARVFHLPRALARPLRGRLQAVNEVYDEVHERFGSVQVDLGAHPGVYDREFWSVDRLHPSELGHRALAHEYAEQLALHGLRFRAPEIELDGLAPSWAQELRWLLGEGVPWCARRTRDLGPGLVRSAWQRTRSPQIAAVPRYLPT